VQDRQRVSGWIQLRPQQDLHQVGHGERGAAEDEGRRLYVPNVRKTFSNVVFSKRRSRRRRMATICTECEENVFKCRLCKLDLKQFFTNIE
jgi:hypothetical protein